MWSNQTPKTCWLACHRAARRHAPKQGSVFGAGLLEFSKVTRVFAVALRINIARRRIHVFLSAFGACKHILPHAQKGIRDINTLERQNAPALGTLR